MSPRLLLIFAITELLLCLTPGPAVLLVISQGLKNGFKPSLRGIAGILVGNAIYFALSALGLGALLISSATLFQIIKWAGAGYLVFIGLKMLLGKKSVADSGDSVVAPKRSARLFSEGLVTQLSNPKAIVFFSALLPQFVFGRNMKASLINVALLQMAGCGADKNANLAKGDAFCRRARAMGADIALFPEMWDIGMTFYDPNAEGERELWEARAISRNDPFIIHFQRLAKELNMAIALTYLEKWDPAPRNSVSLIDRHGEIVLTYAKVHTCEFDIEAVLTPGDGFPVCELNTVQGAVKIGFMICYDREFPESARILMLEGAELLLTPNACRLDEHRSSQFKTRALENMVGVAMTNYAAPQNNGHSVAFDAVAYPVVDGEGRDTLIIEAGESEGVYLAAFDMDSIRAYRQRETWGNAYRRPRLYGMLTAEKVEPPFIREDATR